jgi:hypothetical protein
MRRVPTLMVPFMPASAWPGTEQWKAMPPAGMSTTPVLVSPPWATIFVPSSKVTSCTMAPLLVSLTSYRPAWATEMLPCGKSTSTASISTVPRTSPDAGDPAGLAAGDAVAPAPWVALGWNVQLGLYPEQAATTMDARAMTARILVRGACRDVGDGETERLMCSGPPLRLPPSGAGSDRRRRTCVPGDVRILLSVAAG